MNTILTHGYFLKDDFRELELMRPYPPLGLLYISAFLEQKGVDNLVFDSTFRAIEDLFTFLKEEKPLYLGIYATFLTRKQVVTIISYVKKNQMLNNTRVILGGTDVRYNAEEYLKSGADFLVIGEGEVTFYELIDRLGHRLDPSTVNGIAFLNDHQKVIRTGEREHITNMDSLPLPNRKKIVIEDYLQAWKSKHGYSSLTISSQRGCPYTCRWCSHAVYGDTYRRRSPSLIVNEMVQLKDAYSPDSFWFVDDVFTMSERWIAEFDEEIQKHDLKVTFECITRSDKLNEGILKKLKSAGCHTLWIGAESGSQKVIDYMDRRVDIHHVREMILLTKAHGIKAGTFIMLGYPGETSSDINETIRHLKLCNPDLFTINLAYPIRGTKLFEQVEPLIVKKYDWKTTPDRDIDFVRTYNRKFCDIAIRKVVNEFLAFKAREKGQLSKLLGFRTKSLIAGALMKLYKQFS